LWFLSILQDRKTRNFPLGRKGTYCPFFYFPSQGDYICWPPLWSCNTVLV
jgi:hypothetical protein